MSDENRDALEGVQNSDVKAESSTATGDEARVESRASEDVTKSADSSDAGTGEAGESKETQEPKSMLEAVQRAVKGKEEAKAKPEEAGKQETDEQSKKEDAKNEDDDEDQEDSEDEKLPFAKHPRFRKLLRQRAKFKEEAASERAAREALEQQYKEPAERFQQYTAKVREMGLEGNDVNYGFAVMHALKSGDLDKAAELLKPINEQLALYKGEKLPKDLQEKVEAGSLDEASARELASTRAKAANAEHLRAEERKRTEDTTRQRDVQAQLEAAAKTVTDWENDWKRQDPDYQRKQPLVMEKVELRLARLHQAGKIPTVQEARKIVEDAKVEVDSYLAKLIPAKKSEVRTVTGGGSAQKANPRPQNLTDAISLAARGEYQFNDS